MVRGGEGETCSAMSLLQMGSSCPFKTENNLLGHYTLSPNTWSLAEKGLVESSMVFMKEVLLSLVLLLHSHITGGELPFSHPEVSVHLRCLRSTVWVAFAWTLHAGPTTDTAPTSWNAERVHEVLKSRKDKSRGQTKRAYPSMPKTDKAPTELDGYPNFQLQI